jgi:hypothetical protein
MSRRTMPVEYPRRVTFWTVLVLASLSALRSAPGAQVYEKDLPLDHPAIEYWRAGRRDRVSTLEKEIAAGGIEIGSGTAREILPAVLHALGASPDAQTLVFSKTSFQAERISPRSPRAIYFGDDVAVGYVPGSNLLEIAAVDPVEGVAFYELEARESAPPRLHRPRGCLRCHQGPATLGVPGVYVSSVHTTSSGRPEFRLGSIVTDHRTAFADRWGGWYVDAIAAPAGHRGNLVASDPAGREGRDLALNTSVARFAGRLDRAAYPSTASDVVALMTLEHQTQMTNLLIRAGWEARIAEREGTQGPDDARVEEIVRYMLFADEVPLEAPIRGVSTFTETFPKRGPRDEKGRSLRDFDLEHRLFRYPLSYVVYSELFDALPSPLRERIYRSLFQILTARDRGDGLDRLSREDRRAILEILVATKKGLPLSWLGSVSP